MTRRELLGVLSAASLPAREAPAAQVSIARCPSYNEDLVATLGSLFGQIGGLERLVKGKTVTIKLNLTGSPALRLEGRAPGVTHYTHPKTAGAVAHLMNRAGARRIRFVESCWATAGPLEEYLLDAGWNLRTLQSAAPNIEFENTNAAGKRKRYARFKTPGGGLIFPAYDLNAAYQETDVFVSMAKLKEHGTCGVTLAMKNLFGMTPASIYGDDAGAAEPNENPSKGRAETCHLGIRQPSKSAPGEIDAHSSREPGYRMPRIVAELNAARPVDLALIDGIETMAGGEGPWIEGVRPVRPGLLLAGTNAVCTDAVATALMGYDPRARRGTAPFLHCDNTLLLAESLGLGAASLDKIEVRGARLSEAVYRFG